MKTGVLRVHSVAVFLMKVESIMAKKPFLGQMMGFGTLLVIGAGGVFWLVGSVVGLGAVVAARIDPGSRSKE